jgi:hypothetical protein
MLILLVTIENPVGGRILHVIISQIHRIISLRPLFRVVGVIGRGELHATCLFGHFHWRGDRHIHTFLTVFQSKQKKEKDDVKSRL